MTDGETTIHPFLLAQHAASTASTCPKCDYALRGLTSDTCPECGAKLLLTITSPGARSGNVPARFILWWCAVFHLGGFASMLWSTRRMYVDVLGQSADGFPDLLWQILAEEPLIFGVTIVLGVIPIGWLALHRRFLAPAKAARWTPRVCIALLVTTFVLAVFDTI